MLYFGRILREGFGGGGSLKRTSFLPPFFGAKNALKVSPTPLNNPQMKKIKGIFLHFPKKELFAPFWRREEGEVRHLLYFDTNALIYRLVPSPFFTCGEANSRSGRRKCCYSSFCCGSTIFKPLKYTFFGVHSGIFFLKGVHIQEKLFLKGGHWVKLFFKMGASSCSNQFKNYD